MNNIAFKRAKTNPDIQESLHPDFITEYADTSLFEEGFHKSENGYEILDEESFNREFSKNSQRHLDFLSQKRQLEVDRQAAEAAVAIQKAAQDRKDNREFEEFIKWKNTKGSKR